MKDSKQTKARLFEKLAELRHQALVSEAIAEELRRTKKTLEEERVFIQDALNSLMDVFYVLDADGKLISWNRALKEVTGYSDDELPTKTVFDFFEGDDIQAQADFYQTLLAKGQAGIEAKAVTKEGRRIPYYFHSTMLRDSSDEPLMISGVGRDISEQKKVEEDLRQYREHLEDLVDERTLQIMMANERLQNEIADRTLIEEELRARNNELEMFAHTISHDLRSSVSIIEGYAQEAREGNGELLQECLEKIVHLTRRMEGFIESLLAYSEAGRPEGTPVPVRPGEELAEILTEREMEIAAKGIEVVIEKGLPTINVDPVRLQQVFSNLLDNAFKCIGDVPAPRITCGARGEGSKAVFYVADNGPGIAPDEHHKIFEPFERLGTEDNYGLGIGLATVKRAVEGWGGKVWVESAPGEGATFFFTVPVIKKKRL